DTGADVAASPSGAAALRAGRVAPDDPQAGFGGRFPPVARVRAVADGDTVRVAELAVTAHFTPGHAPGSTTWTWTSCERGRCLDVVYADSLYPISAPGFHFLADATHGDLSARFRDSIRTVAALPCDILISVHPEFSGTDRKLRELAARPAANPFVDAGACRAYARIFEKMLAVRLEQENAAATRVAH
ncbi:MAG TPA: MBL fold metallo-hydrolase, partial [Dokdonella sp.]